MQLQPEPPTTASFERILVACLAILTGLALAWLAIAGPLFLGILSYKTAPTGINQIMGQDLVNLLVLSPLTILAGLTLLANKPIARYLLVAYPLYLMYYVLSYTIGLEWSSPSLTGNSEQYTFAFLFILVSALISLLYGLSVFPRNLSPKFGRTGLRVYSVIYVLLILVFASMWIGQIKEILTSGTTAGYAAVPTAFWLIRIFDLGFTIPLGLISVYLLWTRPATSAAAQFLFYGFFLTMLAAVNAMGLCMFLRDDPDFDTAGMLLFMILLVTVTSGFIFVLKNHGLLPRRTAKG